MSTYYYKVKGSADDDFNVGSLEADSEAEALKSVKKIYGTIEHISIIDKKEFAAREKDRGIKLTHRIEDSAQ